MRPGQTLRAAATTAVILTAVMAPAAAEDLTIVSVVTTSRGHTRTQTQYLSATRIRTADEERDTIVDFGSGKISLLDRRRKEYSETSMEDLRSFLAQLDAAMAGRPVFDEMVGAATAVSVQKQPGGRKIAGYETEAYTLTIGDLVRFDVWTTPAVEAPAWYFEARKVLYATMGPMGRRFDRLFDEMKKVKGFPLATAVSYRMRVARREVTTEATEVRKGPIPESTFAVPADYNKVESPFGTRRPPRPSP